MRHCLEKYLASQPPVGVPCFPDMPRSVPYGRDEYHYKAEELSVGPRWEERSLNPMPAKPVVAGCPPQAKPRQIISTDQYKAGQFLVRDWDSSEKEQEEYLVRNLVAPVDIAAEYNSNSHSWEEQDLLGGVHGLDKMDAGLPWGVMVKGDPNKISTEGCYHTLASIKAMYPDIYSIVYEDSCRLAVLTWGSPVRSDGSQEIRRVCHLDGLRTNDRSKGRSGSGSGNFDGSYNLGGTVMKGEGQGFSLPAAQANHTEASAQIGSILEILGRLYWQIMQISLAKSEYELNLFHSKHSNLFGVGGLHGGMTSVQMNVSSTGGSLKECLGKQGFFHSDDLDSITRHTMFVLLFNLPPGRG